MKKWEETTERFIAFIDIMGFSNYVFRNEHKLVKKRMIALQRILANTELSVKRISKQFDGINEAIRTVIFSDSILLITIDQSKSSLENILYTCQLFLSESFKKRIPLKGAISYGTITADFEKSLFFGKGLIDAYSLQEQLFMYGVVLDEKIERRLRKKGEDSVRLCKYGKVPTKSGMINHFTVDWMSSDSTKAVLIMNGFYNDMSGYPRKYLDNTIEYIEEKPAPNNV